MADFSVWRAQRSELLSQDDLKSWWWTLISTGRSWIQREGPQSGTGGHDSWKERIVSKSAEHEERGHALLLLDADSYLELKLEVQTTIRGALQENELYYGDYEQVNGIYYPFAVEQRRRAVLHARRLPSEKSNRT